MRPSFRKIYDPATQLNSSHGVPRWVEAPITSRLLGSYYGFYAVCPTGELLLRGTVMGGTATAKGTLRINPLTGRLDACEPAVAGSQGLTRCVDLGVICGKAATGLYCSRDAGTTWETMGMETAAGVATTPIAGAARNWDNYCDLGNVTWNPGSGNITRRVLLWGEYATANGRLFARIMNWQEGDPWPQDGTTGESVWHAIIEPAAGAIAHYHGVYSFRTANNTQFVVGTVGDDDACCGVLLCQDVPALLATPDTYKTYWGLDVAGAARQAVIETNKGTHVVDFSGVDATANSSSGQTGRIGSAVYHPGENVIYLGGDSHGAAALSILSVPLGGVAGTYIATSVAGGGIPGQGLSGLYVGAGHHGTVIFGMRHRGSGVAGSDGYARLVAVMPGGTGWRELKKWQALAFANDIEPQLDIWRGTIIVGLKTQDELYFRGAYGTSHDPLYPHTFDAGHISYKPQAAIIKNWAKNPLSTYTGQMVGYAGGNVAPAQWDKLGTINGSWGAVGGATALTVAWASGTGHGVSLKLDSTAAKCALGQKIIRAAAEVYCPAAMLGDQSITLRFRCYDGVALWQYSASLIKTAVDGWWTFDRLLPVHCGLLTTPALSYITFDCRVTTNAGNGAGSFAIRNVRIGESQITPADDAASAEAYW